MANKFDIADIIRYECSVTRTRMKLCDKRTGEMIEVVLFHPGIAYPLDRLGKKIGEYGYSVMSCEAEDTVTGMIPWNDVFTYLENKEEEKRILWST